MISFSKIREWVHDLIYGRTIPKRFRYMTVDIQKTKTPVSTPKAKPSIRLIRGERIIILPFDDPKMLAPFAEANQDMVYRYMLTRFQSAFKYKKSTVVLFQFGNTKKIAQITSDKFETQLTKMLEFFVKIEDYESATQCRDLIRGLS